MGDMAELYDEGRWGDEDEYRFSTKECMHCGQRGLKWTLTDEGWRLYKDDEMHNCPQYKRIQIVEKL